MGLKFEQLERFARDWRVLVEFSAGVDSTFSSKWSSGLGERAIALTASHRRRLPAISKGKQLTRELGCRHVVLDSHE